MEVGCDRARFEHRDRRWAEVKVQRAGQPLRCPDAAEIDMGHLAQGVHAAIGAPRGDQVDRLAGARQQRLLDGCLHRRAVGLALPALERRAVIFEQQAVTRHRSGEPGAQRDGKATLQLVGRKCPAAGPLGQGNP